MNQPLRNLAVEHNTREAFRCMKQWQIFRSVCIVLFLMLVLILALCFSL